MNDTISREAVADAINGIECTRHTTWYEFYQKVMTAVEKLPPAEHGTNLAEVGTDCISRKALINKFEQWQKQDGYDNEEWNLLVDVITEIKNMPLATDINVAIKDGTDCISRKAAIDAIDECYCGGEDSCGEPWIYKENAVEAIQMIEPIPSAEPKRGKWIPVTNGRGGHECDKCHEYAPSYQTGKEYLSDFCPNCGANMRGEQK